MESRQETPDPGDGGALRAGVGKVEITTGSPLHGVRDPLYARALVLDDGATRVAIVTMDTTAIGGRQISDGLLPDGDDEFLPRVRARLESELGIPAVNVLVNASHTHPPGRLLCDDDDQVTRTVAAVAQAAKRLEPVRIGAGTGIEDRITMNRDLRLKDGRDWTVRHSHPSPPSELVAGHGPIDPEIGILRIDRLDGRPLAVVYNFACHLLFGDLEGSITANLPGVASGLIEQTLGHGAMALYVQGAAGDIIDIGFKDLRRERNIEPLGTRLGESVVEGWRQITTGIARLRVVVESLDLPRRTDIPQRVAELEKEQASLLDAMRGTTLDIESFLALHGERDRLDPWRRRKLDAYAASVRAMERLVVVMDDLATLRKHQRLNDMARSPTIPAEVMGVRIGDAALITSPAELLVEVGLKLKAASPFSPTLVAGFTNGYLHYGPPPEAYERGGYEVRECLLAPEWEAVYLHAAGRIFRALKAPEQAADRPDPPRQAGVTDRRLRQSCGSPGG